jgi:hypothetical protein
MFREPKKTTLYEPAVADAVQTLSTIAELEEQHDVQHNLMIGNVPISFKSQNNPERVVHVIRSAFGTILDYLKDFYKRHVGHQVQKEGIKDIHAIMKLVQDAAKKLDTLGKIIHAELTSIKECVDVQTFYEKKIVPMATKQPSKESSLHQLVPTPLEQARRQEAPKPASPRVAIDLESIKNDEAYELFFIRKENGDRFFTPKLLRNVKAVSQVEEQLKDEIVEQGPIAILQSYQDMVAREHAKTLIRECKPLLDEFVKAARRKYNDECAACLYKAVVALFLASYETHPAKQTFPKGSSNYFSDFERFLKEGVHHAKEQMKGNESIEKRLSRDLLLQLFTQCEVSKHIVMPLVVDVIEKGKAQGTIHKAQDASKLSEQLRADFEALLAGGAIYSHVPIMRMLQALEDPEMNAFDPMRLKNWPEKLFEIEVGNRMIPCLRIPSPTTQEYIHKAKINDEFLEFVHRLTEKKERHLMFNMQNRTSWREFSRSKELEDVQKKEPYAKALTVVTMSKDTDFYHQTGPYQQVSQADLFMEHLLEHMASESSGNIYPDKIKQALFPDVAKQLAVAVHDTFFSKKNMLSQQDRRNFIELYYLFLQMKIIELVQPSSMSVTCKDAIDIGLPHACELFLCSKVVRGKPITHKEDELIRAYLFGLPFIHRGRCLNPYRLSRFIACLKTLETESLSKDIQMLFS